jgi:hypothetical protein
MTPRNPQSNRIKFFYLLIGLLGVSLIGFEIYLNSKNASLCKTEGCFLVHIFDTYGILNYIGLAIFAFIFITALLDLLNFYLGFFLRLRTYLLALSIIVEGYFIGFQTWFLKTYCQYCLIIASLLFLALLLDFLYPEKEIELFSLRKGKRVYIYKMSLLGFFSIFFATYLVNFPLKTLEFSSPVLIYKEDCPYCEDVISYTKTKNIKIKLYKAKDVIPFMETLNLNSVPLLINNERNKVVVIEGKDEIINWFEEKYGVKKEEFIKNKREVEKKLEKVYKIEEKGESTKKDLSPFIPGAFNATSDIGKEGEACTIEKPCE